MADEAPLNLKVIGLEIENVKRIRAAEITPRGNVVEITGRNGQGKTSVLDSLWWVLSHGRDVQRMPIRKGEEQARITAKLGDGDKVEYIATRTFDTNPDDKTGEYTTKLVVARADGQKLKKAVDFLGAMLGPFAMDPVDFIRSTEKERVSILRGFVEGFDWKVWGKERERLYDARHAAGIIARRQRAVADELEQRRPESVVEQRIDTAPILAKVGEIEAAVRAHSEEVARRAAFSHDIATQRVNYMRGLDRIRELELELAAARKEAGDISDRIQIGETAIESWAPLADPPTTAAIEAELAEAERLNTTYEVAQKIVAAAGEAREAEELHDGAEHALERHDLVARQAVEKAQLPVRGLVLGIEDVMLHGVPFDQASDAEQLRAALAIAIAGIRDVRVIRIRDGSLLDHDAMEVLREVAEAENVQFWIERVIADSPDAIVIEAGEVRS